MTVSDLSEGQSDDHRICEVTANWNDILQADRDLLSPVVNGGELVCQNRVSYEVFSSMPGLANWRRHLVPSAFALYSMYHPEDKYLPNGVEVDPLTQAMFLHSPDAKGIRSRSSVMSCLASKYIEPGGVTRWLSVACGTAVPVFNAFEANRSKMGEFAQYLVDIDRDALRFAVELGVRKGLDLGKDLFIIEKDLISDFIRSQGLLDELGEVAGEINFVEGSGIAEYFGDRTLVAFIKKLYDLVKPNGACVVANMLDTHPQLEFNQRGVGWPGVKPRSLGKLKQLMVDAGIEPKNVTIFMPDDGIYAVLELRKPVSI